MDSKINAELRKFDEKRHKPYVYLDKDKQMEQLLETHNLLFDKLRNETAQFRKQLERMENLLKTIFD